MLEIFKTIFEYREYLKQSVARDFKKKYRRSVLGYLWSMLNPLFMMTILTLVFSSIMRMSRENYAVFLFSALIPWAYFQSTVMANVHVIRGNMNLISQMPVPKYLFVLSNSFTNLVNLLLTLVPLLLVMVVVGQPVTHFMLQLPIILLPLFVVSLACSLVVAVLSVFFQDSEHLIGIILQALYFMSPIIYGREVLPEATQKLLFLNPMFHIIDYSRDLIYYGQQFNWTSYGYMLAASIGMLVASLVFFKRSEDQFIYFA